MFVIRNDILMDPQGSYLPFLFGEQIDINGLLASLANNYIKDKVGITYFTLDNNNESVNINFGVDQLSADLWNQFLNNTVFQPVEHKYTQKEIDMGFSVITIYTIDGEFFNFDFSNIAFEIPVDETQNPAKIIFNAPLVENKIVDIDFTNDGDLTNNVVSVTLSNSSGKDWVGLYLKGETPGPDAVFIWGYVDENNKAVLTNINPRFNETFPNSVFINGNYEFILLENDSYTVLDRVDYSITENEPEPNPCVKVDEQGECSLQCPNIIISRR